MVTTKFFQKKKKWLKDSEHETLQTESKIKEKHLQQQTEKNGKENLWDRPKIG